MGSVLTAVIEVNWVSSVKVGPFWGAVGISVPESTGVVGGV
jgi:hypothetical protein